MKNELQRNTEALSDLCILGCCLWPYYSVYGGEFTFPVNVPTTVHTYRLLLIFKILLLYLFEELVL